MADNKRIAKNTIFLYFRMLLVMGVNLYTSRVVLSVLGFEDYGLYNVIGGIVTMFTFLNGSLGSATSRYITFELGKKNFERLNRIFNTALVIHIFIAILVVLLAETVGLWFFYEKMTIPADRLDAAFWVYQISILTCFFTLTQPMDRLVFYAILLCLVQIGIMLFYRYYCKRHYPSCKRRLYKDKTLFKEMFAYGSYDLIGNISVLAQGQGLNILLNMFYGPTVNAARGIAYQVQGAITQFSNNFMTAVRPQIIKSYAEGDVDGMMKLVKQSSCFSFYLMWMISLPVCLEADYLLSLWLGKYPEHTVNFLILIVALCLVQTIKTPRTTIFHATGHIKWSNIIVGIILCAAFPLAYVALKLGGSPESVFWMSNLTMLLSELASVSVLKRYIDFSARNYLLDVHGRCLLVAIVSFIVPYLLYDIWMEQSFLRLAMTCMLTTISVLFTSLFLGMDRHLRSKLIQIINKKISRK